MNYTFFWGDWGNMKFLELCTFILFYEMRIFDFHDIFRVTAYLKVRATCKC